jgi:hypothetical protein
MIKSFSVASEIEIRTHLVSLVWYIRWGAHSCSSVFWIDIFTRLLGYPVYFDDCYAEYGMTFSLNMLTVNKTDVVRVNLVGRRS